MISEPFYFGNKKSCFGHYMPARSSAQGRSVLIVPSIFGEAIRSHWVIREMAKLLTGQGYDVLRFDFDGDGNSCSETHSISVEDWVENIRDAYAELLSRSKAISVSVFAIRFGAGLSFKALESCSVDSYVLWDPIISGEVMRDTFVGSSASEVPQMKGPFEPRPRLSGFFQVELGKEFAETFLQVNDIKIPEGIVNVIRTGSSREKLEAISNSSICDVKYPCDWQMGDLPVIFAPKLVSTACGYL